MELIYEPLLFALLSLKEYIALHLTTCLIPTFLVAISMVTFVSKETIVYYKGASTNKVRSFASHSGTIDEIKLPKNQY